MDNVSVVYATITQHSRKLAEAIAKLERPQRPMDKGFLSVWTWNMRKEVGL